MQSVREKERQSFEHFCGQPDCVAGLASFDQELGGMRADILTEHACCNGWLPSKLSWPVKM